MPIDDLEGLLAELPEIVTAEAVGQMVARLLEARCQPLVFYRLCDVAPALRRLAAAPLERIARPPEAP